MNAPPAVRTILLITGSWTAARSTVVPCLPRASGTSFGCFDARIRGGLREGGPRNIQRDGGGVFRFWSVVSSCSCRSLDGIVGRHRRGALTIPDHGKSSGSGLLVISRSAGENPRRAPPGKESRPMIARTTGRLSLDEQLRDRITSLLRSGEPL